MQLYQKTQRKAKLIVNILRNGSCVVGLFCGAISSGLFLDAKDEVRKQAEQIVQATNATLTNSTENLFRICDDYCNRFPLSAPQNNNHIAPSI